jgi:hypothetical protein
MSTTTDPSTAPQGAVPAINIPNSQDYPRLVFTAPYHETVPLAELIEPAVIEATEAVLPALVPPYVNTAVTAAVQQQAVLLTGSTMQGPLYLSPIMPTQPSQAASMSYVDLMVSTGSVPEVPAVPTGQTWARQTGQWVPVAEQSGVFLPISGGTMQGQINMAGNAVVNLGPLPVMPNGAAPAQWVLSQIAAQSLYQGTWVPDTNTPDLTQPSLQQNAFAWIVATPTTGGVVVSQPIPGLQGLTVFNGDTVLYSTPAARFQVVHATGTADNLYLPFTGGTMTGPLTLFSDPQSAMQAATMQWVEAQVTGAGLPEAPADGQLYGRNGATKMWTPSLPLAGGVLTGSLTLPANATQPLNAVPLQQLTSTLSTFVPLAGATMTGPLTMGAGATLTLNANAAQPLQAIPLQQMQSMLGAYVPVTGNVTVSGPLTMGSTLTLHADPTVALGATTRQYVDAGDAARLTQAQGDARYVAITGSTMSGNLITPYLYAVNGISPSSYNASEWYLSTDNASGDKFQFFRAPGSYDVWRGATGNREWWTSGAHVMTLSNVGVLTTASNIVAGAAVFASAIYLGPTNDFSLFVSADDTRWLSFNPSWAWGWQAATGNLVWSNAINSSYDVTIGGNGLCYNSTGAWLANSDVRLKQDIEDYVPGLDALLQVRPRTFNMIADVQQATLSGEPARRRVGVIAQEIETVIPETVIVGAQEVDGTHYDDLRHYDSGPLLYTLVNAVKELHAMVLALQPAAGPR